MAATLTLPQRRPQPPTLAHARCDAPPLAAHHPHTLPAQGSDMLDSRALLQGQKSVTIVHNGAQYRLQATKLGKLILTK